MEFINKHTSVGSESQDRAALAMLVALLLVLVFISGCQKDAFAGEFIPDTPEKVELLADAIFWAEGGYKTNFPYGIKSIKCEGYDECRKICKNTIKNNIKRYKTNALAEQSYLRFFQSRYCPTTGNLTASEEALNGYWLKNVKWFLDNPKEI